jgi:hypothetical protein
MSRAACDQARGKIEFLARAPGAQRPKHIAGRLQVYGVNVNAREI